MRTIKVICLVLLLLAPSCGLYATWSIIVVDAKTKEIGIAGASCTPSVYGIGAIVPGKGAIIVQAMSNGAARRKGIQMIMADEPAEAILQAIKNPVFEPEEQQYAIVLLNEMDKPVTYTGNLTTANKGTLTSKGISVQGNTLTSADELKAVLNAAQKAQKANLPIADVLLLALEAGANLGGDKRCGERKASSAFLTVAKPSDAAQKPSLNLIIYGTDDSVNAVEALRRKFNKWKTDQ